MPRPDPFDFLARNGVHIRSPTATTQSSNQGLEVPPDGRTKEDVTQIIFYEVPAEGNSKNMVQKVEQALTEHGGTDTRFVCTLVLWNDSRTRTPPDVTMGHKSETHPEVVVLYVSPPSPNHSVNVTFSHFRIRPHRCCFCHRHRDLP